MAAESGVLCRRFLLPTHPPLDSGLIANACPPRGAHFGPILNVEQGAHFVFLRSPLPARLFSLPLDFNG
jgi:hypothetical protein